jgi:hypothetical protein
MPHRTQIYKHFAGIAQRGTAATAYLPTGLAWALEANDKIGIYLMLAQGTAATAFTPTNKKNHWRPGGRE